MDRLKYRKTELVAKIQSNRDNHRSIFNEAMDGYLKEADKLLKEAARQIRAGRAPNFYSLVQLPVPEDHTKDYDAVLAMLDMTIVDDLELTDADFRAYVLDQWRWKDQFIGTVSNYTVS